MADSSVSDQLYHLRQGKSYITDYALSHFQQLPVHVMNDRSSLLVVRDWNPLCGCISLRMMTLWGSSASESPCG